MDNLTGKQKMRLRAMAHGLDPMIRIGKNGLTEGILLSIEKAFKDSELVKIRFIKRKDEKEEIIALIIEKTQSHLIEQIGNTAVFKKRT